MKKFLFCFIVFISLSGWSQYNPNKSMNSIFKSDREPIKLSTTGMSFLLGPTYGFSKDVTYKSDRYTYLVNPSMKVGVSVGLGHVKMKSGPTTKPTNKFIKFKYYRSFSLCYNHFIVNELISEVSNSNLSKELRNASTPLGNIAANASYHALIYKPKLNVLIDQGLGIALDYRIFENEKTDYFDTASIKTVQSIPDRKEKNSKNLFFQLNYSIGIGFQYKRGYIIPSMQIPIVGFYEWDKFNAKTKWFSSSYRPVLFQIRVIRFFTLKTNKNDCNQFGSDEDKKRSEQYLQGK